MAPDLALRLVCRWRCGSTASTRPTVVGARGLGSDDLARLRVHGDATAVGEVHVPEYRAIRVATQTAVVNSVAGAGGEGRLLGLLLGHGGLGGERLLVGASHVPALVGARGLGG